MTYAALKGIEYYLPRKVLTTEQIHLEHPEWSIEKIEEKTGISTRFLSDENECASDMAVEAAQKLFDTNLCKPKDIDTLILCTQSPDYFLPTTACILQDRLGLSQRVGAFDINLGCSGYIYGLGLAKGLIETSQSENVLLLTAETYTKFIHHQDKSVRTIFSDAAAATLINTQKKPFQIGPFVYGTDGSGYQNLIVPVGGMRHPKKQLEYDVHKDEQGNQRTDENLFMHGHELFNFTLRVVEPTVTQLLEKAEITLDSIDYFIFHQANKFMLDYLRKRIKIPKEKFIIDVKDYGNTVSSTIPLALKNKFNDGTIQKNQTLMLVGFGVGYSWGATLIKVQ
ncbi:MAG: ketoacyl-ACP synthase III [SAR324 cluster bacterium]|nr:ketoacyl-ACP synthase III [SAR324 cluster bacterium]